MKFLSICVLSVVLMFSTLSCTEKHLIGDEAERAAVQADFENRAASLTQGDLFKVFEQEMSEQQREALTFLYAYMPLGDITDYSGEFFLENIDYTFRAKEEMPWGKLIPEREFRHFVLPVRVNNENLDNSRKVFYEELKDRVKNLSLHDAVLEVNHWCHEKVVYTPSDARTSSPLASVKTAYGRCGEESTFTVAALRSVGIPARQVYTPRWAHTDDNHAWVEAWVDGKWYFLGACEPEPVLNLGWFNAPASRGMLMHTKVFGRYNGPEEIMHQNPNYTEINIIGNYAPAAKASVKVTDADGQPVKDAKVEFKVYNYAEFYTVATKKTDDAGQTFLSAGKGDMLVWASKDGRFGYGKLSFGKDATLELKLDKKAGESYSLELDIVPPAEGANMPEVTAEQRDENNRRMAIEDSIRNAYVGTFMSDASAREFAKKYQLDEDAVAKILVASRGNHDVITNFMARLRSDKSKAGGIDMLQRISAKDLRDVSLDVLIDHMQSHVYRENMDYFRRFIRNPRVANEMLTPYKAFFKEAIPEEDKATFKADWMKLVAWVSENIRVDANCNLGGAPISPAGVWKARVADAHSRDIFFVSMARSLGIPSRIDEVTGKVQLINVDGAIDVDFGSINKEESPKGKLIAKYKPIKSLSDPKYYSHFSISKLTDEGTLQLLNYDEGDIDMGEGATWSNLLKNGTALDEGNYLMVTGTRLASGGVLAEMEFFPIHSGKTTTLDLVMRESQDDVQVIGSFNSESLYKPLEGEDLKSILNTTGRGYFVVAVLGVNQEPTNHALRDIAAKAKDFEDWGRGMVLLFPSEEDYAKFRPQDFPGLPKNITFGIDKDGSIQAQIAKEMKLANKTILPMFIIGDTFNRVVFVSQGYTIGLGEQLMKVIHKL
ncbi:MAG: transglutaminase domain-containing protein [Bacteroidaceae bacterium]|nr:transglutaminase domain-containing protein [Bacteroidaceae bacterium]